MIVFPNCKINLGLSILRKRNDGYHDLVSVFYPLPLHDVVEALHAPAPNQDIQFSATGLPVNGTPEENLCIRAYRLLKKDFPQLPGLTMHLHKVIPMGAGLGGGSANGAFTLKLLNEKFHLGLSKEQLLDYALRLGSDCPFFIINTPCIATGRGEFLQAISLDLSAYSFMLIHPGVHINTAWAFSQLGAPIPHKPIPEVIRQPVETWKEELVNDFEEPVYAHHPRLRRVKQLLYDSGALYASMSGSGSSFYGLFPKGMAPVLRQVPAGYTVTAL